MVEPMYKYMQRLQRDGFVNASQVAAIHIAPRAIGSSNQLVGAEVGDNGSDALALLHVCGKDKAQDRKRASLAKEIVHQQTTLQHLNVCDMKEILCYAEPHVMTPFALKALCTKGARDVSKKSLTELIEYMSGFGSSDPVYSIFRTLGDLCVHVKAQHEQRGRPGQTLNLQGAWADVGVYGLVVDGDSITLSCKHTKRFAILSGQQLQQLDYVLPLTGFTVVDNYSESKATLRQQGRPRAHALVALLGVHGKTKDEKSEFVTPAKRARFDSDSCEKQGALQNGSVDAEGANSSHSSPGESGSEGMLIAAEQALLQASNGSQECVRVESDSEPPSPTPTEVAH
eukprot:6491376-Amphidinium_carterae.1